MMPQGRQDTDTLTNPRRWPLVNILDSRQPIKATSYANAILAYNKDARIINGFVERDLNDGEYWIYKRPGFASFSLGPVAGGIGYGMTFPYTIASPQVRLSVFGGSLYSNEIIVGPLGATLPVSWQLINFDASNHANVLIGVPGQKGYYYSSNSNILTQITDVNFPSTQVSGWAYLDGFIYAMDATGRIYQSTNQNDPTTWSPLNTINASSNADAGICLAKQLNYIIAFKQWSTQVFYDAGNQTGSSLSPVPDAQIAVGTLDATSVQSLDDTLFWVSSSQSISPKVMQMDNLSPQVISTPAVERLLAFWAYTGNSVYPSFGTGTNSFILKIGGHRFYGITNQYLNLTLVYDIDQKKWMQWTDANGNYFPYFGTSYLVPGPFGPVGVYMQHMTAGILRQLSLSDVYASDGGTVFPVDIYTPNYDGGSIRSKTLNAMYFESDIVPGSKLLTRFSDDDYNTWTQFRETDLNTPKPFIDQEGTFEHRRAYHLRHMGNQPFRIKSSYMQLDFGTL